MTTFEFKLSEQHLLQSSIRLRQFNSADLRGLRRWLAINIPLEFRFTPEQPGSESSGQRRSRVGNIYVAALLLMVFTISLIFIEPTAVLRMLLNLSLLLLVLSLATGVLLFVISRYFRWTVVRSLRMSPLHNVTVLLQLDQTGLTGSSQAGSECDPWTSFLAACLFEDGLLVTKVENQFIWLPFAAITGGSREEAEQVIRENIAKFRVLV